MFSVQFSPQKYFYSIISLSAFCRAKLCLEFDGAKISSEMKPDAFIDQYLASLDFIFVNLMALFGLSS